MSSYPYFVCEMPTLESSAYDIVPVKQELSISIVLHFVLKQKIGQMLPAAPSALLRPGETYRHIMVHRFSAK
ncbi:hypothetical protein N8491_01730 [Akkermansiaceae bacterium]|nr:hypothetical protein [Akkermansiaceae bacterium]MDA9197285.1 hypothetical protein [Akkermansiaceae bacterium]MDB4549830.1 hypothetical protein [Akkermansiaceae bacterium]